jgi:3-deoxy-manno-octulosonate cytidylyltransferase (CMP-KDO synthetase)
MPNFIGIIPARYASTRFPGKPLVTIHGKTMIERVYNQSSKVFKHVAVATDDERIEQEVLRFGGNVIMTSSSHQSGTDRCYEAACKLRENSHIDFDVVVNIQGDEPFIQPVQFEKLMHCFTFPDTQIATLVKQINSVEDILNPNHVKVVIDKTNQALYFSRSVIPYIRNKPQDEWIKHHAFFTHIGIYAYRFEILQEISRLSQSSLEIAESLEQLRWIENGYKIRVEQTNFESIAVDTPDDLEKINKMNLGDK